MPFSSLDIQLAPGESLSSATYKARIVGDYILEALARHKDNDESTPLMIAMQGPQGSGKTTLTDQLQKYLSESQGKVRSAVLSLDDLYLSHQGLLDLAARYPGNMLLSGRGLPGTHDLDLAAKTLHAVTRCNQGTTPRLELPVFDKSAFGGQGDRSSKTMAVNTPVNVFILEGWSMGFQPLSMEELCHRYELALRSATLLDPSNPSSIPAPAFLSHSLESLLQVNQHLVEASKILYPPFTHLMQIRPTSYAHVYAWRIEQERAMIAQRGEGMNDDQVREFVGRYMPGYELWGGETNDGGMWRGKTLVLHFGKDREVVSVEKA